MLNNKNDIQKYLTAYGLSSDEAKVYLALLEKPLSHLEVARKTGVNRTKVYRIADDLEKKSLVKTEQLDGGKVLSASQPRNLEVALTTQRQELDNKREIVKELLPALNSLFSAEPKDKFFSVSTYEGVAGMKQMLWNELKAKGEVLVFGSGTLEDLVGSKRWAESFRARAVDFEYKTREVNNSGKKPLKFTNNEGYMRNFSRRHVEESDLNLEQQMAIYEDTVSIYHWRDGQKVGAEIHNKAYANTMRQVFEHYWEIAKPVEG